MGNWLRRVLRIEPGVSLAWWAIERAWSILSNWTFLSGLVGGVLMTYWTAISNWADQVGPAVVGGIGIGSALIIMLAVSRIRLWNTRRAVEKANERYVKARVGKSSVNPLAPVFTSERIDLRDLIRPLTNEIQGKSFVRCQIIGPVNVVLLGTSNMAGSDGVACEAVYVDNGVVVSNAVLLRDCDFRDCEFFNVTFMVLEGHFEHFVGQTLTSWITRNPRNYTYYKDGEMQIRDDTDQKRLPYMEEGDTPSPAEAEASPAKPRSSKAKAAERKADKKGD